MNAFFAKNVLDWYHHNQRDLPWRENTDPYSVWLSEIILQQTQVEQGLSYFLKIAKRYPTVRDLALANDDEFFTYWAGLGYYSRARNLLKAARIIVADYGGKFPQNKATWLKLPGIGDYTASAIASIAFNESVLALDGNLIRVFARIFARTEDFKKAKNKKSLSDEASRLLPRNKAGDFNQALMDLGSSICTNRKPKCTECPVKNFCAAFKQGIQDKLPYKPAAPKKETLHLHYLVSDEYFVFLKKRNSGFWKDLYELPAVWQNEAGSKVYKNYDGDEKWLNQEHAVWQKKHLLTHKTLYITVYKANVSFVDKGFEKLDIDKLEQKALPSALSDYFKSNLLF